MPQTTAKAHTPASHRCFVVCLLPLVLQNWKARAIGFKKQIYLRQY